MFITWFAPVLVFIHFHLGIYFNQHTLNLPDELSRPFTEFVEKTLAFPSRWRIINNRNNIYTNLSAFKYILCVTQIRGTAIGCLRVSWPLQFLVGEGEGRGVLFDRNWNYRLSMTVLYIKYLQLCSLPWRSVSGVLAFWTLSVGVCVHGVNVFTIKKTMWKCV